MDCGGDHGQGRPRGTLADAISAYQAKHDRIARTSTMPWDIETLRGFGTALLIPVATWLATTVVGRLLLT